jgi:hypothetical protein
MSTRMLRLAPTVRPPRPPAAWNVDPARPPLAVWASTITIEGSEWRYLTMRIVRASRPIAAAQTPFARQRRHWLQTALQGGKRSGR